VKPVADAVGPSDELVAAARVVPGRADDDEVEGRPIDRRRVPRRDRDRRAALAQGLGELLVVAKLGRRVREAGDRNARQCAAFSRFIA
jgi:hypothetical protein